MNRKFQKGLIKALKQHNLEVVTPYNVDDCVIDFYIPKLNLGLTSSQSRGGGFISRKAGIDIIGIDTEDIGAIIEKIIK